MIEFIVALCIGLPFVLSSVSAQAAVKPGSWELVVKNGGVSAMHMTTTYKNTVVMFDRTDFGPSQLRLPNGRCRDDPNDQALTYNCWAHSIQYRYKQSEAVDGHD